MPRRRASGYGGLVFYVFNRAVRRHTLFFTPEDYLAFLRVMNEAAARVPMRLLEWCLMRNHWHLLVWPRGDADLTAYISWIDLTHACRWSRAHGTRGTGPVYQGRFNAIPVQSDASLLIVASYILRNPVEKHLVRRAEDWPWSSASTVPLSEPRPEVHGWPIPKPTDWSQLLHLPQRGERDREFRRCLARPAPFGSSDEWRAATAERLAWTRGLRRPGRPRKPRPPDGKPNPE